MVQCLLSHGSVVDTHNADNLSPIQITQSDEVISILETHQSSHGRIGVRSNSYTNSLNTESDKTSSISSLPKSSPASTHDNTQGMLEDSPPEGTTRPVLTISQLKSQTKVRADVASTYLTAGSTTLMT
eukprot:TRINITY_DN4116_c0_g1_i3.p2 TRINITY_DN4116_c0_g1~~TRINITY_DN4116_c0_g1_i3.p2  ORF type:complete len:128 (-),score=26.92 TRINITY_DN4116_c0_g1_i3:660-1043(-)